MSSKAKPPVMRDDLTYEDWKSDVEIWSDYSDLEKEKQGSAVYLTLTGKAQQTVRSDVTRAKMKSATGLTDVLNCLDKLFKKDETVSGFDAYEQFSEYRRSQGVTIKDFLVEFNLKYSKLKTQKMVLPDGVLAFYVLKCANLSGEQVNICKATCANLTYEEMQKQIVKVTSSAGHSDKQADKSSINVQTPFYGETECGEEYNYEYAYEDYTDDGESADNDGPTPETCDAYYTNQHYRPRGPRRGGFPRSRGAGMASSTVPPRLNMLDEYQNPTRCSFCKSIYHYVAECPDAARSKNAKGRGGFPSRRPAARGGMRGQHRPSSDYI